MTVAASTEGRSALVTCLRPPSTVMHGLHGSGYLLLLRKVLVMRNADVELSYDTEGRLQASPGPAPVPVTTTMGNIQRSRNLDLADVF